MLIEMFGAEQLPYARRLIYELVSEKDPIVAPGPGPLEEYRVYGHDSYRYEEFLAALDLSTHRFLERLAVRTTGVLRRLLTPA